MSPAFLTAFPRGACLSLCTLRLATGSIHLSSTTRDPAQHRTPPHSPRLESAAPSRRGFGLALAHRQRRIAPEAGCVVPTLSPNPREKCTTVTFHNYAICRLPHDHWTSGTRQQRQRPDLRPPQAAGALKIALQGAHAMHVPTEALEELDQSTLLLLFLSVLCASHVQVMPKPCGGIDQSLYCLWHDENIGPRITFCEARYTRAERSADT